MGNEYDWGVNPIQDFLVQITIMEVDFNDPEVIVNAERTIQLMLINMGVNPMDMRFLKFKLKTIRKGYIRVVPENIVTAMWFIGALPTDCDGVLENNAVGFKGKEYKFNRKTKRLSWKEIKE